MGNLTNMSKHCPGKINQYVFFVLIKGFFWRLIVQCILYAKEGWNFDIVKCKLALKQINKFKKKFQVGSGVPGIQGYLFGLHSLGGPSGPCCPSGPYEG